jgi:sugar lactone lactonase YvrE
VRRLKSIATCAAKVALTTLLNGVVCATLVYSGLAGRVSRINQRPKHIHRTDPVFVTNPGGDNVTNPGGGTISVYPDATFGNVASLVTNPNLLNPTGIAFDSAGNIYVADTGNDTITVYAAGASGAPNPIATIAGSNTGLSAPSGLALDSSGNIYVANCGTCEATSDSITVYPAGSNGNVTPTAVISGTNTGLNIPGGIALDANRNIYVTNGSYNGGYYVAGPGTITEYSAGSTGNVAPIATLSGSNTELFTPSGIFIDPSGNIWVTNDDRFGGDDFAGTVEEFPPGSNGNVTAMVEIYGSCSSLSFPYGVGIDSAGNIYVADAGPGDGYTPGEITVYAAGSDFCATPQATISGTSTGFLQPTGLILDSSGNIYVTDYYLNDIAVFSSGSNGNIAPTATVADPNTGINYPLGVSLDTSGNIYIANAGTQNGGYDSITVYPAGSNANVPPTATISGLGASDDQTGLTYPAAVWVGPDGYIHVANEFGSYQNNGSITYYSPGSNGNVAPSTTISGSNTGLNNPIALVENPQGYLHVLNASGGPDFAGSITTFAPGSSGNASPWSTISGTSSSNNTCMINPSGMAYNPSGGGLYVTNQGSISGLADSVTFYTSTGNVAPAATISGPSTQLNVPVGIAVDSIGNIWVANDGSLLGGVDMITVYPPGSNGDVAPAMMLSNGNLVNNAVISGPLTVLNLPNAIAFGQ